jgi:hypothetical protein
MTKKGMKATLRFTPYVISKHSALPECGAYMEHEIDMLNNHVAVLTDVETSETDIEDDLSCDMSNDERYDINPSLNMEWSEEDLLILLALFDKTDTKCSKV